MHRIANAIEGEEEALVVVTNVAIQPDKKSIVSDDLNLDRTSMNLLIIEKKKQDAVCEVATTATAAAIDLFPDGNADTVVRTTLTPPTIETTAAEVARARRRWRQSSLNKHHQQEVDPILIYSLQKIRIDSFIVLTLTTLYIILAWIFSTTPDPKVMYVSVAVLYCVECCLIVGLSVQVFRPVAVSLFSKSNRVIPNRADGGVNGNKTSMNTKFVPKINKKSRHRRRLFTSPVLEEVVVCNQADTTHQPYPKLNDLPVVGHRIARRSFGIMEATGY
jgi:hypothetical protein